MDWTLGSSNGLLCLLIRNRNRVSSLLLWNPAIRQFRQVTITFPEYICCHIGFGFGTIVNDYKIVRLDCLKWKIHLAEVFSVGRGSWKKIEVGNLEGLMLTCPEGFTVNGSIFWIGFRQELRKDREYVMVSFDIATEVFALIPVPALNPTYGVHVTEFEHRLAILCSIQIGNDESCLIELFVLEEGTGIWAKKYTSSPYPWLLYPITIWRNVIACIDESPGHRRRTVMSSFTGTELKVLFARPHFIFNYAESLVPVSNIHIEEC